MTDAERVLAVLIHDVRTPLGVAHGYLRLLRGDKLPKPEDRDRALASTQEALAKISRICQDAGLFLEEPPTAAGGRVPASHLIARVTALLAERGIAAGGEDDGAWTPGDAARDALRVLEVAAGVALVVLALAVPLALLAALAMVSARWATRRRRERALDVV